MCSDGGVLDASPKLSFQYNAAWLLEIFAYCAVDCFALISGYVGVSSKYKYQNILTLWLQVWFHSVIIAILFTIFGNGVIGAKEVVKSVFPVVFVQYWYFTAYFGLFIFMPILNLALNQCSKRQLKTIIVGLLISSPGLQPILHRDILQTSNGYSVIWLVILYLVGGYIKRFEVKGSHKRKLYIWLYIGVTFFTWAIKILSEWIGMHFWGKNIQGNYLIDYTSPTIVASGILLLLLFKDLSIGKRLQKHVKLFTPLCFGTYIVHAHPLVMDNLIKGKFESYAAQPWIVEIMLTILTAGLIFLVCAGIDWLRLRVFVYIKKKQKPCLDGTHTGNSWTS